MVIMTQKNGSMVSLPRNNTKIGKKRVCLKIACAAVVLLNSSVAHVFGKSSLDAPRVLLLGWQHPSSPWMHQWAASNTWLRLGSIIFPIVDCCLIPFQFLSRTQIFTIFNHNPIAFCHWWNYQLVGKLEEPHGTPLYHRLVSFSEQGPQSSIGPCPNDYLIKTMTMHPVLESHMQL